MESTIESWYSCVVKDFQALHAIVHIYWNLVFGKDWLVLKPLTSPVWFCLMLLEDIMGKFSERYINHAYLSEFIVQEGLALIEASYISTLVYIKDKFDDPRG